VSRASKRLNKQIANTSSGEDCYLLFPASSLPAAISWFNWLLHWPHPHSSPSQSSDNNTSRDDKRPSSSAAATTACRDRPADTGISFNITGSDRRPIIKWQVSETSSVGETPPRRRVKWAVSSWGTLIRLSLLMTWVSPAFLSIDVCWERWWWPDGVWILIRIPDPFPSDGYNVYVTPSSRSSSLSVSLSHTLICHLLGWLLFFLFLRINLSLSPPLLTLLFFLPSNHRVNYQNLASENLFLLLLLTVTRV